MNIYVGMEPEKPDSVMKQTWMNTETGAKIIPDYLPEMDTAEALMMETRDPLHVFMDAVMDATRVTPITQVARG